MFQNPSLVKVQEEGKPSVDLRIVIWFRSDQMKPAGSIIFMLPWLITLCVSIYKWPIWVLIKQAFGLPEVESVQILFTGTRWSGHGNSHSGIQKLDFRNWLTTFEKTTKSKCAQPLWVLGTILPTDLSHLINYNYLTDERQCPAHACPLDFKSCFLNHCLRAKTRLNFFILFLLLLTQL